MADAQKKVIDPEAEKWLNAIKEYEREFKKWEKRAEKIVKVYRDYDAQDDSRTATSTFNILWANVQVLMPAVFARLPKPDVSRRFRDNDPVGRVAGLILERALDYEIDHYPDYRAAMGNSVLDRFLGGRGTAWVRYEPHIVSVPGQPTEGVQITEDADEGSEAGYEEIETECAPVDYVHWKDFGHTVARTWEEVTAVWRRVYMSRDALVKRFGEEVARTIPMDVKPNQNSSNGNAALSSSEASTQACVYEIWDKTKGEALWFSKNMQAIIDRKPDPLQLANYFPCPKPLYATLTTDSLIPVPDYKLYQDQAQQLNKLAAKIDGLIDQLKVYGVYDAAVPELVRLFKEAGNGDLIPVKNYAAFAEKSGISGTVDIFDLQPTVAALIAAYDATDKAEQKIYQIMGIADIVRGSSDPGETLGAQKLKGQFGNMRLRGMQGNVIGYATELLQIKAQIMCKHFQPETLARIAAVEQLSPEDQQLIGPAMQLLLGERAMSPESDTKIGPLSGFRIEVSSDSMIQMDEQQEKADRSEFLNAVGGFIERSLPVIQASPQAAPLIAGLLKFGITGYKVGKTVEGMIDNAIDQLTKQAAQPQPEQPDPEMIKIQGQLQLEDKKAQNAAALEQQRIAADKDLAAFEQRVQAEQNTHQQSLDAQRAEYEAQMEARLEQQRLSYEAAIQERQQASDERMNQLDNQVKLLIARMQAETQAKAAESQQEQTELE